jgi:chromate reductase, NAD(P)H dehydrogenase (quinone)
MSRYPANGRPRILVFAGSTRTDSFNKKLARATAEALQRTGVEATLVDLRDYPMPIYDGDLETAEGIPPRAKAFKELLRSHDAFAIASPEYNGSFPALVKNVIDWASRPEPGEKPLDAFRGKTAALVSASPGGGGGQRALRHLRELLETIGVTVIATQVTIPRASEAFDSDGRLVRSADVEAVNRLASDVGQAVNQAVSLQPAVSRS